MKYESKIYIKARRSLRKVRALDLLITVLVVVVLFSIPILLHQYLGIKGESLGVYGDFFGSINTFVSALAFAGLIYTIILQRADLRLQREELLLTRDEIKRQATAQENSVREQAAQVKLLEEQINKDIRPYINAYWEMRNYDIVFSIKNIGKCACSDFRMECETFNDDHLEESFKVAFDDLIARMQNLRISIFPSSIDYSVALINPYNAKVNDIDLFYALKNNNVSLLCKFSFMFRGKLEPFKITYDFKSMELFENESLKFHKDLIKELQEIRKAAKNFK